MIEKKTVLDQIEITSSGAIQIRIGLLLVEDGNVIDTKWHRSAIEPGGDIDAQMSAVNAHLEQMGKLPVGAEDIARIKSHADVAWTPDVVKAFRAAKDIQSPA